MSTGRNWNSCMEIEELGKIYIKVDIREGSIIAYLVNSNDLNINNPKARILVKPFINKNDDIIYLSDKIYGTTSVDFKKSVDDILNSIQEINVGIYKLKKGLYDDGREIFSKLKADTKKDIKDSLNALHIKNYTINDDLSVDVNGDVNITDLKLDKIYINFNHIKGNFDCSYNKLTSLEGAPQSVDGYFNCSHNKLTTLQGGPQSVDGHFDCSYNKLTTLKGAPQSVGGNFNCIQNKLTTLKDAPQSVDGEFECSYNKLTTLEGGPKSVSGYFDCHRNNLTTLKGAPQSVGGNFKCFFNKDLKSLKHLPKRIEGDIVDFRFTSVYEIFKLLDNFSLDMIKLVNDLEVVVDDKINIEILNDLLCNQDKPSVEKVIGYDNI